MALLAKKRQARKSQVGSMVMVEFFEKINNHNDHLRLRLLLGYEFWQTDGGNFIPYSQSRADFMKVVSWNSTPQGTLNIWVLLQGSSWTLWCFVALKIWVLSNNQPTRPWSAACAGHDQAGTSWSCLWCRAYARNRWIWKNVTYIRTCIYS